MARKAFRPGRTLVVFALVVVISYGLVALGGPGSPHWGSTSEAAPGSR